MQGGDKISRFARNDRGEVLEMTAERAMGEGYE